MDAKELNDTLTKFVNAQQELNARERLLNRIELKASASGLKEGAVDDLRHHFEKRAQAGERLEDTPIAAHLATVKKDRPHYFDAPAKTSPAGTGDAAKAADDNATAPKIDHATTDKKSFTKFMANWGGIRA